MAVVATKHFHNHSSTNVLPLVLQHEEDPREIRSTSNSDTHFKDLFGRCSDDKTLYRGLRTMLRLFRRTTAVRWKPRDHVSQHRYCGIGLALSPAEPPSFDRLLARGMATRTALRKSLRNVKRIDVILSCNTSSNFDFPSNPTIVVIPLFSGNCDD